MKQGILNSWQENGTLLMINQTESMMQNNAYILVRGDITVIAGSATQVSFESCAPFTKHITKIDGATTDDA